MCLKFCNPASEMGEGPVSPGFPPTRYWKQQVQDGTERATVILLAKDGIRGNAYRTPHSLLPPPERSRACNAYRDVRRLSLSLKRS
jgi:hypothetical protein